jgi:hypothetical protein
MSLTKYCDNWPEILQNTALLRRNPTSSNTRKFCVGLDVGITVIV